MLEKDLSAENIEKKEFAEKSKEYSGINEIIESVKKYLSFDDNKKDLEKILEDKNSDDELKKLAEIELNLMTEERPIDLRSEFQNFSEMAACGTAAVLAPVGKIWFDEKWHSMPGNENSDSSVMEKLYELLVGIQRGEIEDKLEWLHSIDMGH